MADMDAGIPGINPNASQLQPTEQDLSQFNPDDYVNRKINEDAAALQGQYGTPTQQALAGVEATARGATLGLSDYAAAGLTSPEDVKKRIEANPWTAFGGNVVGGGLLLGATGGLSGPIETAVGKSLGAVGSRIASYGAEGALFGAGNAISDQALGDPSLNAQKIFSDIGWGAIGGAGLGALSKAIGVLPAMLRKTGAAPIEEAAGLAGAEAAPVAEAVTGAEAASAVTHEPVVDIPIKGGPPQSLEDMDKVLQDQIKYSGKENLLELPQRAEAAEATDRLKADMEFPVTNMQLDSLNNQDARNAFKTMLEVPGKAGETLRNYQGAQKKDLIGILDRTIDSLAPGYETTTDAAEAGERATDAFTKQIEGTREALGPAFEAIKSTPLENMDHLPGVIDYLTDPGSSNYANPKIANMFDTSGDALQFKPYKSSMGIDRATYKAVREAVDSLRENPNSFETLFDIRKGLSQHVDVLKLGDAPKEIASAKAAMMDYIQDAVQEQEPDLAVRDTFANWAKNEQNAQMIEKRFGAEIGSGNWRSLAQGKAEENILGKIFKDSDTVQAVKNILPAQDFNKILADHLSVLRNNATDKGVFSSNKFFSQMKRIQYGLDEAFGGNQIAQQKLKDTLTLLRIFSDDVPQNPSGTTKTLLQALVQGGLDPFEHLKGVAEYGKAKLEEYRTAAEINQRLAGNANLGNKLSLIGKTLKKVTDQIDEGSKAIFTERGRNVSRGMALSTINQMKDDDYKKASETLKNYSANPQKLIDDVAENSESLNQAAPNITQALHASMMQAVQFLSSKLPPQSQPYPLAHDPGPGMTQKLKFGRYFDAINNPLSVLKQVEAGTLTNEPIEALQAVHPQLLQEMRQKVMSHLDPEKAKDLPPGRKIALSKFLGMPLSPHLTPQAMLANQVGLNLNVSQQSAVPTGRKSSLGGLKQLALNKRSAPASERQEES